MRGWLALVMCAACGGDDDPGVLLEISSSVTPLDRATVSVYGVNGAIVRDQEVSDDGPLDLPREVRIDGGTRAETVRILVWGERAGERVAFGATSVALAPQTRTERGLKLDAPGPDCDDDGVPDAYDGCAAIADPDQADADGDGETDACVPGAGCPGNLVGNPDFEQSTVGWGASTSDPATLERVAGGHASGFAAQICKGQTTGTVDEYSMDDRPGWITPVATTRYRVDAWMRSMSAAPQRLDLRLGEQLLSNGNAVAGTQVASVQAPVDWSLVTTSYTATGVAGTTELDIRFRVLSAPDGTCFQLDDVCAQIVHTCP